MTEKNSQLNFDVSAKYWCFQVAADDHAQPIYNEDVMEYLVFAYEEGQETGYLHYQGFVGFKSRKRFSWIVENYPEWLHVRTPKYGRNAAQRYCCNPDKPGYKWHREFGVFKPSKQGQRTDLMEVSDELAQGARIIDVVKQHPIEYIKYNRGIERMKGWIDKEVSRTFRQVEVHTYYGAAGTGKSRLAFSEKDYYVVDCSSDKIWFDFYDGESTIILDDFNPRSVDFKYLMRLLDGHQMPLEVKGSKTFAKWTKVIITSSYDPVYWYTVDENGKRELYRRLCTGKVLHFKSPLGITNVMLEVQEVGSNTNVIPTSSRSLALADRSSIDSLVNPYTGLTQEDTYLDGSIDWVWYTPNQLKTRMDAESDKCPF